MSDYSLEQLEGAIKLAYEEGNTEAVNSLSEYYLYQRKKEKEEFSEYKPTTMADVPKQLSSTYESGKQAFLENAQEFGEEALSGQYGTPKEAVLRGVGKAAPVVGSAFEAAAKTVGQGLSLITYDPLEKWVAEQAKGIAFEIKESPSFRKGVAAAKKGIEHWNEFSEKEPEAASRVEDYFNVATLSIPPTKVKPFTEGMDRAANAATAAGVKQAKQRRDRFVYNIISPLKKDKSDILRTKTTGFFRTFTVTPSEFEKEIIEAVAKVPTIKAGATFTDNSKALKEAIDKSAVSLIDDLKKAGNPSVDKDALLIDLQNSLEAVLDHEDFIIEGGSPKMAKAFVDKAMSFISESDGTAIGVLQARKNLDEFLNSKQVSLDADYLNSKRSALKLVRDKLNEYVDKSVPEVDVKSKLRKQYLMYNAWDNLSDRALDEAANGILRTYRNIQIASGTKLPTTPLALAATASAGAGFLGGGLLVPIGATGAAAGVGALSIKGLASPAFKKQIGSLLRLTNDAIKKSKSVEMVEQLKADRLILISLLQNPTEEDQKVPYKGAQN